MRKLKIISILLFLVVQTSRAQNHPIAVLTISGPQQGPGPGVAGSITIAFNSYSVTVPYGQFSTPASIAAAFAARFSVALPGYAPCTEGVCAKASGATIQLQLSGFFDSFGNISGCGGSQVFQVNCSTWPSNTPPAIGSLSPKLAPVNAPVFIYGSNFGSTQGTVFIHGYPARILTWSDSQISITVPLDGSSGTLQVTTATNLSATAFFTVPQPYQACPAH